jgi:hypothetical protein
MKDGIITDDFRIVSALPTIKYLIENKACVILMSHMGKPKGEPKPELSLKPVADRLTELLDVKYYEHAYASIIGRNGTFISHPDKRLGLQKTIFNIADEFGHPELTEVGQEMIDGKSWRTMLMKTRELLAMFSS